MFHTLFKHVEDVWEHLLGDMQSLLDFWEAAANADDEWYRLHPVVAGVPAELRIHMGIHGDDADVHEGEQVLVISWNRVTFKRPTLDSRIVFTMLRVANIVPDTMTRVYEVLKWISTHLLLAVFRPRIRGTRLSAMATCRNVLGWPGII